MDIFMNKSPGREGMKQEIDWDHVLIAVIKGNEIEELKLTSIFFIFKNLL